MVSFLQRRHYQFVQAMFIFASVTINSCQINPPILSIPAYSKIKAAGPAFCQKGITFPSQQASLLNTEDKVERYETMIGPEMGSLFRKLIQNSKVFDISQYTPTDLTMALSAMIQVFESHLSLPGMSRLNLWLDSNMTSGVDFDFLKSLISSFPTIIPLFKKVQVDIVLNSMTEDELEGVCILLLSPATPTTDVSVIIKLYPHCAIFFSRQAAQKQSLNMTLPMVMSPKSGLLFHRLRDMRDLLLTDFLIDPSQVKVDDIENIPEDLFREPAALHILGRIIQYLRTDTREHLAHSLLTALGSPAQWTETQMNSLMNYLMFLSQSDLSQYITDEVLEILLERNNMLINDNMSWMMMSTLYKKRNSTHFIRRLSSVLYCHPYTTITMLDKVQHSELLEALKTLHQSLEIACINSRSAENAQLLTNDIQITAMNLCQLSCHQHPMLIRPLLESLLPNETATIPILDLAQIAMFLPFAPDYVFKNANAFELFVAWPDLQMSGEHYNLPKLKIIYERIKGYFPAPENMKLSHLKLFGPLLLVLPCDSLLAIPDQTIALMVSEGYFRQGTHLKCNDNPEICWILASKALKGTSASMMSLVVTNMGPLGRYIKLEDLDEKIYYNSYFSNRVTREMHLRAVYQRPELDDADIYEKTRQSAMNEFTITYLPESSIGPDLLMTVQNMMQDVAKAQNKIQTSLLDICYFYLRHLFGLRDDVRNVCVTEVVVSNLACFFMRASKADLAKLSVDSRKNLLWAEGRSGDCASSMLPQQIHAHFQALLDVDIIFTASNMWTPEIIIERGPALFCGMNQNDVNRLSPQTAFQFGQQLCQCAQLSTETRKALFEKILNHFQGSIDSLFSSPHNIRSLDSCLMFATDTQLLNTNVESKKLLVAMTNIIMNAMWHRLKILKLAPLRKVDAWTEEYAVQELAKCIQRIMDEMKISKLDQVIQFTKFPQFLTSEFINSLTSKEFVTAVDYLRDNNLWTPEQTAVLNTRIKETFGNVSTWTRLDFLHIKKLLGAVFPDGFGMVRANMDNYTLKSVLTFLADDERVIKHLCSEVDDELLFELASQCPKLLCCMSVQQVEMLEPQIVVQLMQMVEGSCYPCLLHSKELLKKLAIKFREYMVSKNLTDEMVAGSLYRDMKCVSAFLPTSTLLALGPSAVVNFDVDAIKLMSPDVFCQLATPEILGALSTDQLSVMEEKIECMSTEQLVFLQKILEPSSLSGDNVAESIPDFNSTEIGDVPEFTNLMILMFSLFTRAGPGGDQQCNLPVGKVVNSLTKDSLMALRQDVELRLFPVVDKILYRTETDVTAFSRLDMQQMLNDLKDNNSELIDTTVNFLQDLPVLLQQNTKESIERVHNMLAQIHPRFYTLFTPQVMCEPFKKLKKPQLMILCDRLYQTDVSTQSFITFNSRCPVCIIFMDGQRKQPKLHAPLDRSKGVVLYAILMYSKRTLDLYHLALIPEALTYDVISAVSDNHFKNIAQLSVVSDGNFHKKAPEHIQKIIMERILKALDPINSWSELFTYRLQNYIFKIGRENWRETYQPGFLIESLLSRDGRMDGLVADDSFRNFLGQIINLYIMNTMKKIPKDVLQMPQMFCLQLSSGLPKLLLRPGTSPYDSNFLLEMAEICLQFYSIPRCSIKKYIRQIITDNNYNDSTLLHLKGIVHHLAVRDIQKFPKLSWLKVLPYISGEMLDYLQLLNIWDIIKKDYPATKLTCDQIKTLGRISKVWTESYISLVPADILTKCIHSIAAMFTDEELQVLPKPFARALWGKDVMKLQMLDLKISLSSDQQFLMTNEKVAETALTYYPDKDIAMLQDGEAMGLLLERLSQAASYLSTRSVEVGFTLLKKRIGLTDSCIEETICFPESQAKTLGGLFVVARPSELKCLTKKTQNLIFETIGSQPVLCRKLPRVVIRQMFDMAQTAAKLEGTQKRTTHFGCLVCGHTLVQVQQMTDNQVDNLLLEFSNCPHLDLDTAKTVVTKAMMYNGGFQKYVTKNPDFSLGPLIRHVLPEDITSLPTVEKEVLTANIGKISSMITQEAQDHVMRRGRREISDLENELRMNMTNQVLSAVFTVALEVYGINKQWRNERVNDGELCSLLEEFDGNVCFLTLEHVNSLPDWTVRCCASQFQTCNYSSDILTVLAFKSKNAMNTTIDQWQITDYAELGKLIGMMGEESIKQMTLNDDIMAALPLNTMMPKGDLLIKHYLSHNRLQLSELTAQQIADYGLLLGQLPLQDLNKLEPDAVGNAALIYDLGSLPLEKLPFEKIQMFTNKIIESAKIDLSKGGAFDIERLGSLAGALPEKILMSLTSDQKRGLTPSSIALIPGKILAKAFTIENVKSLTSDQANAVIPEQKIELSSQQRAALSSRATAVNEREHDSGSKLKPWCFLHFVFISAIYWISVSM